MRTEIEIELARYRILNVRREIMDRAGKEDPHVVSFMGLALEVALESMEWFAGKRDTVAGIQLSYSEEGK